MLPFVFESGNKVNTYALLHPLQKLEGLLVRAKKKPLAYQR